MLSTKHRLAKTTEITAVTTHGRRFFSQFFVLKALFKTNATPRVAFVVSTKISKLAVERNRVRRVLRETVRPNIKNLRSGDYVVIVKASVTKLENKEIAQQFLSFLQKIKVVNK